MKSGARVLRVALLRNGAILTERLVPMDTTVTLGGPTATLPGPSPCRTLFRSTADGTVELVEPERFGPTTRIDRGAHDRGRLCLADGTVVLFQYVPAPVVPAVPAIALDFRPRLIDPDDVPYLCFLALQTALAATLSLFVYTSEVQEVSIERTLEHVAHYRMPAVVLPPPTEGIAVVEVPAPPIVDRVPEKTEKTEKTVEPVDDPETVADAGAGDGPGADTSPAAAGEAAGERLEAFIASIGTTGEGELHASTWSGSAPGSADLDAVGRIRVATADADLGLRQGTGDLQMAGIVAPGALGGGRAEIGGGPVVNVQARVEIGQAETTGDVDVSDLRRHVRRRAGQMKYCYESALKRNPTLSGRVAIGWTVEDGHALDPFVAANGTGDQGFAECMVDKVAAWSFPGVADGPVVWPFVFTSK